MTENYTAPYTSTPLDPGPESLASDDGLAQGLASGGGSSPAGVTVSPGSQSDSSTVNVAKDEASNVAQAGVAAGQHTADVAKEQVANVAAEAGDQVKDLIAQTRSELTSQAAQQQDRIAKGLRALSQELKAMTEHDGQAGPATDVAQQGAERTERVASWLEEREPGNLLEEATQFARRKPGMFLLLMAGAGVMAGRLTRGVKDASGGSESSGMSSAAPSPVSPDGSAMANELEFARPYASSQDGAAGFANAGSAE
jgi:hypothetical protein